MTLESAIQWAFAVPGRIQQNEWELITFLGKVQSELKPKRTVELGSWRGATGALLSLITSHKTISLDIQDYGGKDEASKIGAGSLAFLMLSAMEKDSLMLVNAFMSGLPIDLLFMDDGHRIEEVTREYELWKPMVRPGGWIAFHDINPEANKQADGTHADICQAHVHWPTIQGNKEEIIFRGNPPGPGIGILRV